MSDFYMVLQNTKPNDFTVSLSETLHLDRDNWRVALTQITHGTSQPMGMTVAYYKTTSQPYIRITIEMKKGEQPLLYAKNDAAKNDKDFYYWKKSYPMPTIDIDSNNIITLKCPVWFKFTVSDKSDATSLGFSEGTHESKLNNDHYEIVGQSKTTVEDFMSQKTYFQQVIWSNEIKETFWIDSSAEFEDFFLKNVGKLQYNGNNYSLKFNSSIIGVTFHNYLHKYLGFKDSYISHPNVGKLDANADTYVGELVPNRAHNFKCVQVCSDLCEDMLFGNEKYPCLNIIWFQNDTNDKNKMYHWNISNPQYIPLVKSSINSIKIELKDQFNNPVVLNNQLTVVLHFKKHE